jgi:transcriptional regulator with XRE-family HTH domain
MALRSGLKRSDYDALRAASGWYLAAWRDFRQLTLAQLATLSGSSPGAISDLETGHLKKDGKPAARFNRDSVERMAKALDTSAGHLIDVNPFDIDQDALELLAKVPQADRERVLQILRTFVTPDCKSTPEP